MGLKLAFKGLNLVVRIVTARVQKDNDSGSSRPATSHSTKTDALMPSSQANRLGATPACSYINVPLLREITLCVMTLQCLSIRRLGWHVSHLYDG